MIETRSQYHVALADIGLVLQGSPEQPGYAMGQASTFNSRYAQGDRGYDDFSKWWYWSQTDWFQGIKDSTSWEDDGKYYFSTNIDTWSEIGAIKLAKSVVSDEDFTEQIVCGGVFEVNGAVKKYIGTRDNGSGRPVLYSSNEGVAQTWTDISSTNIGTNAATVAHLVARSGILWVQTTGAGTTYVVNYWDGSAWYDASANINTGASLTNAPASSRCGVVIGDTLYLFVDNSSNDQWALVKTAVRKPTAAGDWALVFEKLHSDLLPIACAEYDGNVIYLAYGNGQAELRKYDIANAADTMLQQFKNITLDTFGVGDRLLVGVQGKLVITLEREIWELDGSTLTRIFKIDDYKESIGKEAIPYLRKGCIELDNKLWWGNLMYDGAIFYNTFKDTTDATSTSIYMLMADFDGRAWFTDSTDDSVLFYSDLSGSSYKSTADKNYLVMNQFDSVSGIDKLLYSVTLIFKKFVTGQSIKIEYATGELTSSTTWTELGTASYALDAGTVTEKTLFFPVNTTCKKIWYRIQEDGGGSDSPVLYDIVTAYLPRPYVDRQWSLNFDCGNALSLINGGMENRTGREIKGRLEQAWLTGQIVDFQDLDYAATAINDGAGITATATSMTVDDTSQFPESGRLKVDDEVMFYTGKTPFTFTGLSRGQKGTKATTHADNATVHNGYKVIIQSFNVTVPIANQEKNLEYVVGVSLREVV